MFIVQFQHHKLREFHPETLEQPETISCCLKKSSNGPRNGIKLFTVLIYEQVQSARVFVPGRPFQPCLIFPSKAAAYPSGPHFKCCPLGQISGLIFWLERSNRDKHPTLLGIFVKYGYNMFYNTGPRPAGQPSQ